MNKILQDLQQYGIYEGKIDKNVIEYWNKIYFNDILKNSYFKPEYNQHFRLIDLMDKFINDIFLSDIIDVLSIIYNNKAKIRDLFAVLTLPRENQKIYNGHAGQWHTDLKDSFAMMILLNDISINDTHMEYVMNEVYENKQLFPNFSSTNKNIKSCIGEAGTFFLFSNGDHIHRQNLLSEKSRKTLHAIYLPENSSVFKKN